ncbi:MAG TPA: uracil-DNA glycosylase [Clostridia bacterium]|nr:MAG: Uracil DNA glycosylase superfamily protein [Firmicutes bacterium ADurb.Bin146]HOD93860.1 uracil-DNA glycosylase [Clostridia bacterium]HQM39309.1 uracil-DNA glycosylase [Clostridia bacterium]
MNDWLELEKECAECKRCTLWENRKNIVIGRGNKSADFMLIGEAPGEEEDRQGRAFVGKAGQLLSMALSAMGIEDDKYYICNVIKCRPQNNRTPYEEEIESCIQYLDRQIDMVKPKVIVLLGNIAAVSLIKKNIRITQQRGTWDVYKGIPVMMTYHPAALLRDESKKIDMWRDLKNAWKKLQQIV